MSPSKIHRSAESSIRDELNLGEEVVTIRHNAPAALLYEDALEEHDTAISSTGALIAFSGKKTGRSPKDKRIVDEATSSNNIWWGPVNKKCSEKTWLVNRERAADYLKTRDHLYIVDAYAGWDPRYRIKVRVVCARAYHALFMTNMLIRPSQQELKNFGEPDFTVWNAGQFPANTHTEGMSSKTTVEINFKKMEMVILGTEYAGEMKKGIFTVMFYLMPVSHNVLTLHSSANQGIHKQDVTLFFGLSGTGKTTLSADPHRELIGDDEHCWSDHGVFNIEGGCYAKCIGLSQAKEPEIYNAIKFGAVLENVAYDPNTRAVDYDDCTITENTRCAYPIEYIPSAKIPCMADQHPSNIILLTCDASGVLPPVSHLSPQQVMYHFISGYTSKVAGTEDGVTEPEATFSSCFGQPFLALHPMRYAEMLAEKMHQHKANAWLINTGWTGAGYLSGGQRCPLKYTRAILDAIHDGSLVKSEFETLPTFNLRIPTKVNNVPSNLLNPSKNWSEGSAKYGKAVQNLANLFVDNFKKYESEATKEVLSAGPKA
ncbi:LAMI_0H00738g1_1 [Lachancea mirantina]|uniref:Phosphoenolpyruvate carboxykinase (ATP) n=1 Tax=Lachancea mirantina TaxID=1230905 RepID=A0A1G4KDX0_9SACH|nr:LAMI_0H00738g1_1 [Lachancea mirantina]